MALSFAPPPPSPEAEALRAEVRAFLKQEWPDPPPAARVDPWMNWDADFSRKLGARGWIGMTWPKVYGGHERSAFERYVVIEELLAAGAPVAAHWIADRQSGPNIIRYGSEAQRQSILPRIAAGDCYFCIGMSEPDTGSDLAAVRTRAVPVQGGWLVNGTKVWTTGAHHAHYMILFCKTGPSEDRHGGASQFVVDMTTPGVEVRGIVDMKGAHHFNEVVFRDVFLPKDAILGKPGDGWKQVTGELAYERSGPERFLSSFALLTELVRAVGPQPGDKALEVIGRLSAHILTLRRLSRSIAGMLEAGQDPGLEAAIVKDMGNVLEQELPEIARTVVAAEPELGSPDRYAAVLAQTILAAPSFSLRGGTREILRGIIARGLGLR